MSSSNNDSVDHQPGSRRAEMVNLPTSYATYVDRWAIVVGISKYKHERLNLKYADRDAEALYELLLTPSGGGFEKDHIVKLVNEEATTANITRALRSFLKKPAKEDIVLIYFACHGAPDIDRPGIVYLLTHDVDPTDISGTALPMREIDLSLKENLLAERVIILADTCHSAAIGGGIGTRDVGDNSAVVNSYLQEVSKTRGGLALLTSAEANEVSFEDAKWGGGHGVFTHYVLEGMKGAADRNPKNGVVTVGELFEYVRENVQQATGNNQHPCVGTNSYDRNLPVAITAGISAQEHYELGCQLYQVGMKLNDRGRLQSASRHLQEAIRLARITGFSFIEAQLQLGLVLMNIGDLPKAIEAFKTTTKNNLADAAYYLGIAYAKQGKSEKSVQVLESFLKQYPQDQKSLWIQEFILQQTRQYSGTKYALLIGIDKYPAESGFGPLEGSLNDVQLVRNLLSTRFAFSPENICILTENDATYSRILLELQELVRKSTPNDTVIVHFSGHSIEPAKYKHYLVTYDSITPFRKAVCGDKQDLADETSFLNTITAQQLHDYLNSISGNKTLILDTHANPNFITLAEIGDYTLLLATSPNLPAYERKIDEKRYGFFTYSLVEQLQSVSNIKLGQLQDLVIDRIQSLGGKQLPIFTGDREEYFFANHNHLLDFFNFSQRRNYSIFTEEQLEQQHNAAAKQLTVAFPEFYQGLGSAFLERESYEKAVSCFQIVLKQSLQNNSDLLFALGKAQFLVGQYTKAYETFYQYLKAEYSQSRIDQTQKVLFKLNQLNSPRRCALLVGIDEYLTPTVPHPKGAVNDVLALKKVLLEKHHFQETDIEILCDENATCENILKCFKELVTISKDNLSLFYFAGNGSLNSNGSLTVLGVDSRQTGIYEIELNEFAEIVGNQPTNLISIIDAGWANALSCPNGGRVATPDSRSLPGKRAAVPVIPETQVVPKSNLINTRDLSSVNLQIGYVSIYSKSIQFGFYEESDKIQGEKGFITNDGERIHGILTHALLESLCLAESDTFTYKKLTELVSEKLDTAEPFVVGANLTTQLFKDFFKEQSIYAILRQIEQEPYKQSVLILERLIEQRNGFDPDGSLNLGVVHHILGEFEKSLAELESALAQVAEQQSKTTERHIAEQQEYSEIHYWLGRVLYESGRDPARAVSELRLAAQQSPNNIAALYYLGQALKSLMTQEFMTEAKKAFDIYLKSGAPLGHRKELYEFLNNTR